MNDSMQRRPTPESPNQGSTSPNILSSENERAVVSGISASGRMTEGADSLDDKGDACCVPRGNHGSSPYDRRSNAWRILYQPFASECLRILELDALANRQYERYGPPREGFGDRTLISRQRPAPFASWISFIPSHLRHNRALDAAVDCAVCAFDASVLQDIMKQRHARRKYIKALLILQNVLNGPDALSGETLCAMMVLSLYEVSD